MGFLETVAKAKAYDDTSKRTAEYNAAVAQEVQNEAAKNAMKEQLGLAYAAGKQQNMYVPPTGIDNANAQVAIDVQGQYGVPADTGTSRFSSPSMMQNLGLAGNAYNPYKGN